MFKYFKMKRNEWKIKAAIYGIIASIMDNQQEIIEAVKKLFTPHLQHAGVKHQGGHDVERGGESRQGQQIGAKKTVVLAHPPGGQLGIKTATQASHLRGSAR